KRPDSLKRRKKENSFPTSRIGAQYALFFEIRDAGKTATLSPAESAPIGAKPRGGHRPQTSREAAWWRMWFGGGSRALASASKLRPHVPPHTAREDTVLFPAFREVVGRAGYRELGERFEDKEHELFGEPGGPKTGEYLAQKTGTHAAYLRRVVRALAGVGMLRIDTRGQFTLT